MQNKKIGLTVSVLCLIGLWQLLAVLIGEKLILPSPVRVVVKLGEMAGTSQFYRTVGITFGRILAGFSIAVLLGSILSVLSVYSDAIQTLLFPVISVLKSIPVASFAVLCLMWVRTNNLPILISCVVNIPIIYINSLSGMKSADVKLLQMAKVYRLKFFTRLRYIHLPAAKDQFLAAVSLSSGVAWKSAVAAEIIGLPAVAIGSAVQTAKVYLETAELFAWTVVVLALSALFDKAVAKFFNLLFKVAVR